MTKYNILIVPTDTISMTMMDDHHPSQNFKWTADVTIQVTTCCSMWGSNPRPPRYKHGALPTKLMEHISCFIVLVNEKKIIFPFLVAS